MNRITPDSTDWKSGTIDDLTHSIRAGVSVNCSSTPATNGQAGVLKLSAVFDGRFMPCENKAVTAEDLHRIGPSAKRGTILLSRSNTDVLVGECAYVAEDYPTLHIPDLLWVIEPIATCDPLWVQYVLRSPSVREAIRAIATGTSGSMKKIAMSGFRKIAVLIPSLPEQRKIAAILSQWDRAIELTEKLIAAKQQRKAALMQQLLMGKLRLPGFRNTHWRACELGEVASNSTRRIGTGTLSPVYSVTNSVGMVPMDESVVGASIDRYKAVAKYDFAYNPMRINVGSIAMWDGDDEVLVSPDYVVFRCCPDLDPEFLNHYRTSHHWEQFVTRGGGGSVRVRIYFSDLAELPLNLPPLAEQRAIAAVLNNVDCELDLHRRKLDALRRQKKGLMQQLLTGTVRVTSEPGTTVPG